MSSTSSIPENAPSKRPSPARWTYAVLIVALLFVLMPFLFWRATWFGRPFTDDQLQKALADSSHPREIQHALSQIADRILRGDPTVSRWYPDVVRLSSHRAEEIRLTAAWVMGQDNSVPEFHQALLRLLNDPQPMVRRNAALSLVRYNDSSGHATILAMLEPYSLPAPDAGVIKQRLKTGDVVNAGTLVGYVWVNREKNEIRTTVPGTIAQWTIPDGASAAAGQGILLISPSDEMIWEALRALYIVGQPEDLPAVDRCTHGSDSPRIQQQALETARAIRSRSPQS